MSAPLTKKQVFDINELWQKLAKAQRYVNMPNLGDLLEAVEAEVPDPSGQPPGYLLITDGDDGLSYSPLTTSFRLAFSAGVTGLPDKVAILDPALFSFRITKIEVHCESGLPGEFITIQSGPNVPGLVDITDEFDFSTFNDGFLEEASPVFTRTLATGDVLYVARSNDNIEGLILITIEII